MLEIVFPDDNLRSIVHSYWIVEDLIGRYSGELIRTSPIPFAVLSVNIGRPNMLVEGGTVPDVSLLGLQTQARVGVCSRHAVCDDHADDERLRPPVSEHG